MEFGKVNVSKCNNTTAAGVNTGYKYMHKHLCLLSYEDRYSSSVATLQRQDVMDSSKSSHSLVLFSLRQSTQS